MPDDVDDTVIRPRAPRPPSAPLDPSAREDTVIRPRSTSGAVREPVIGAEPDRVDSGRVASIRIGDRVLRLDRPVVIGRRPVPTRVTLGPEPVLVAVGRRHGQVSGTHLAIRAEGQTVVVEDLRSTNGTVVRPPGSAAYRLPAGATRVVLTGTLVEIGDGVVIEVLSPHLRPPNPRPPHPRSTTAPVLAPTPTRERSTP